MLIDQAIFEVAGGKGGDGKVSFARYKYIPKGGPDGGDGGNGGSVYLLADPGVNTLLDYRGKHVLEASDGVDGGQKQCAGRNGEDLVLRLPPGTLVFDHTTGQMIADIGPDTKLLVAQGGRGGFGNEHFKTATLQTPDFANPGAPGQRVVLRLELKLIADLGLVGKPNAGKSTLLSRISRATPKIADYPFTTLQPQLGIAELPGNRRLVVADLPGLIEGAHQGHGLGTRFLRHIERTRILLHLLEVEPADGSDPIENYRVIRAELASYSPLLAQKPEVVVLSKMDLLATRQDQAAARELIEQGLGRPVLTMSAVAGEGLDELMERCWQELQQAPAAPVPTEIVDAPDKLAPSTRRRSDEPGDDAGE